MPEPRKEFNELCSNVSLRLSLLPRVAIRVSKAWASLREAIKKREEWHEFTSSKQAYGFPYDHDSTLDLVLDIDSFLFEVWSCVELMDTVLKRAYRDTATPFRNSGKLALTRAVLLQEGRGVKRIDRIAELRHFFTHQATPYPAVELSSSDPELVILKENVVHLDDESKFVRLSELSVIVRGFVESKGSLQEHLIKLFESCQTAVKRNSKGSRFDSPDPTHVITDEYNPKKEK